MNDCNGQAIKKARQSCLVAACVAFTAVLGCSTTHYERSADNEVYALLEEKTGAVPGVVADYDIGVKEPPELAELPVNQVEAEYLGEEAASEVGAHILTLEKTLAIAFTYSRRYRDRKDSLYLQALGLTLDRHQFTPIFSGLLGADYNRSTTDVVTRNALGAFLASSPGVAADIESLTGAPADLFREYSALVTSAAAVTGANTTQLEIANERSVSGQTRFGVDLLLKGGGRLALDLTTNFLRFLTGDPRENAVSALVGSFTQPLLRGSGRDVAAETLTQAERDLLYELRSFTRFRKTFAVDVASQYYNVLQARDSVKNVHRGLLSTEENLRRLEALFIEGRRSKGDVGRTEQDVLNRQSSWINSIRRYQRSLDDLKILLGLSTDEAIILDENELALLAEQGLIQPNFDAADASKIAMASRLDLYTQRDRVGDAQRRVHVAANALKPGLDLIVQGALDSKAGNRPLSFDFDRATWSAGFDLDLPLDRKSERNFFRASLITYERSLRDLSLFEDNIKLDVREDLRTLDEDVQNYDIFQKGVDLAQLRLEEQELLMELGQGNAINQVDANNDLIVAQNQLTNALVSHTIARLRFYQNLGILFIKENGQWEEIS